MEAIEGSSEKQALVTHLTEDEYDRLTATMGDSRAHSTRRAYASRWRQWEAWCAEHSRSALPADPAHVAAFLVELADAGKSLSTINATTAAIWAYHDDAGLDDPTAPAGVRRTRAGLSRRLSHAPLNQAHALTLAELKRMLATCDGDGVRGVRDRALLLIGYAAALRVSEIAALDVEDVQPVRDGMSVRIRQSKTNKSQMGDLVGITRGAHRHTCPITALHDWLTLIDTDSTGPIFCRITRHNSVPINVCRLDGRSISRIVRRRAESAGLGDLPIRGHSLRAGHATTASENGVDAARIARTTRHVRLETLAGYVRPAEVLRDTTARDLGL